MNNHLRPLLTHWQWQAEAACRGMDSAVFYSPPDERGEDRRRREASAQAVCAACPVRSPCERFAVSNREAHGVWGGTTERDRLEQVRGNRSDWRAEAPTSGVPGSNGVDISHATTHG
ncbi:WhiB family transcriptional regulator [Streptomyces sp. NPDC058108]|uniref:WhiB family transcriptional regulator n=1 Tax=Streptomyces sp. NPDC058108 TaxID=3346344 RepID=UPI0036E8BA2A